MNYVPGAGLEPTQRPPKSRALPLDDPGLEGGPGFEPVFRAPGGYHAWHCRAEPPNGFEPMTLRLQGDCSAN